MTTVVITRDRLADLQRSLPKHAPPVIVVDNGSSDGTAPWIARNLPDVEVVALAENRGAVARNLGVAASGTPYVAFADDDSWWDPDALEAAADVLDRHPQVAVVAARMLVGTTGRDDPICRRMLESPLGHPADLPGPQVLGFLACGAVVRRTAFLRAGGFDDVVFFGGEEERLALDLHTAGWRLCYVPEVVARHLPSMSRDAGGRVRTGHRNRILTAVMRRPWPVVAGVLAASLRSGRNGRAGAWAAALRSPAAVVRRRRVPADVEAARRLLG